MRWVSNHKNDDTRVVIKWAWYPIRIKDRWSKYQVEWYWLTKVKIRQRYYTYQHDYNIIRDIKIYLFGGYWKNESSLDFDEADVRDEKLRKLGIK